MNRAGQDLYTQVVYHTVPSTVLASLRPKEHRFSTVAAGIPDTGRLTRALWLGVNPPPLPCCGVYYPQHLVDPGKMGPETSCHPILPPSWLELDRVSLPRAHLGHNWGDFGPFEGIGVQVLNRLKALSGGPLRSVPGVGVEPTRGKPLTGFKSCVYIGQ